MYFIYILTVKITVKRLKIDNVCQFLYGFLSQFPEEKEIKSPCNPDIENKIRRSLIKFQNIIFFPLFVTLCIMEI